MNPSEQITSYIGSLSDWRGQTLARLRRLIREADTRLVEEWKWGVPVWSHEGLVCSIGAFKAHVGVNFFQGASLKDPHGLLNSGLDAKTTRSIRIEKDDTIDRSAFQDLVRTAVAHNIARR